MHAKKGLKLLQEQVEGLETMSDDIIDAAKKQAILTLQYGVPYLPNGSDQWRKDLEAGKSDETLKKLTSNMTKQVAAVRQKNYCFLFTLALQITNKKPQTVYTDFFYHKKNKSLLLSMLFFFTFLLVHF